MFASLNTVGHAAAVAAICLLWSCSAPAGSSEAKAGSEFCLDQREAKRLEAAPVTTTSARKLADYYGLCLSDAQRRLPWVKVLAAQGDADAAEELRVLDKLYDHPEWISEKLVLLEKMGIDVVDDVETKANYHWRWRAKRELSVGGYHCPAGSAVDASRQIVVVIAPKLGSCSGNGKPPATVLKVGPGSFAEPLEGGGT